ncbi:MAG: hypothetical protein AAGF25_00700 [Pseudomonadota bacterium]
MKQKIKTRGLVHAMRSSTVLSALLALSVGIASVTPAYAFISNTATASGEAPDGSTIDDTDSVDVSVVPDAPLLTIVKTAVLNDEVTGNSLGEETETITYSYTVTNDGNTTINSVSIIDTHDGSAALGTPVIAVGSATGTPGNSTVDLLPTEEATFTVTYTITAADIASLGGGTGDGDLDNSAVAEGTYPDGGAGVTVTSSASTAQVPLASSPSIDIAKAAYDDGIPTALGGTGTNPALGTGSDVVAGTVITYVYSVLNDGDVPLESVGVTDVHGGTGTLGAITLFSLTNTSGTSLNDDSIDGDPEVIDILQPGDSAVFSATYTVTQQDVDQLQ